MVGKKGGRASSSRSLARLLNGFCSVSEGETTLLDHTVVLFHNAFGDEIHAHTNLPFITAGGSALGGNTGPWLDFGGESHNRLSLSLLRAFGAADTCSGDSQFCAGGPLPGLIR